MKPPCVGKTDLFFSGSRASIEEAKAVCRTCPLRVGCLEEALSNASTCSDGSGVWGGTEPSERRRIRRERTSA